MFQYSTFEPLCSSKKYFDTIRQCAKHLRKVMEMTNQWRKDNKLESLSLKESELGQRLLSLDLNKEPSLFKILGKEIELTCENLDNLKKNPIY